MSKRTSTRAWVNNMDTKGAIEIYTTFKLANTKYATKFNKARQNEMGTPVNAQVLRTFVRKFLRTNKVNKKQLLAALGAQAAGIPPSRFFIVK